MTPSRLASHQAGDSVGSQQARPLPLQGLPVDRRRAPVRPSGQFQVRGRAPIDAQNPLHPQIHPRVPGVQPLFVRPGGHQNFLGAGHGQGPARVQVAGQQGGHHHPIARGVGPGHVPGQNLGYHPLHIDDVDPVDLVTLAIQRIRARRRQEDATLEGAFAEYRAQDGDHGGQ